MVRISSWSSHWLATPILSASTLSQYILKAIQILDQKFCDWASVPILPLKILLNKRRWPIQALCPPLLRVFSRVTFMGSWEFSLCQFSTLTLKYDRIPNVSPSILSPTSLPDPSWYNLHTPIPPEISILFPSSRENYSFPLEYFLLKNLLKPINCRMIIRYLTDNVHL